MSATLVISDNPLQPVTAAHARAIEARGVVGDLCPDVASPVVCRVNGQWTLREDWSRPVLPGDVVEFHAIPAGSRDKQTLLQVAAIAAAVLAPQLIPGIKAGTVAAALTSAGASLAVSLLGAELLGLRDQQSTTSSDASPTYSASLAGNQARLDQPIPVAYGYNRHFPDFACQPYVEYGTLQTAGLPVPVYLGQDQYYHALLCLGQGEYAVRRVLIGDTPIEHFEDVDYRILAPGEQPTLVDPAVVTAVEVSGQELLTGQYIGGYVAVPAGKTARALAIDVTLPGLGTANSDGSMSNRTVTAQVQTRVIDDLGLPQSAWSVAQTISITDGTTDPIRLSYWIPLATPARVEVRMLRTDLKQDSRDILDDWYWASLRAYLTDTVSLCPTATHLEVRMRASEQLNGLSQRQIGVTAVRKVRTWSSGSGWSAPVESRNPAWALADKWRSTVYGDGLPDSRIDLPGLAALAALCDERQDRCDIVFDTSTTSDDADQLIASTCRAAVFRRQGVRTVVRDGAVALPVTAFTARTIEDGSWRVSYAMPTTETPDGIRIEYLDHRIWDWASIDCPLPGVTTMTRPQIVRLPGITGATHAQREGRYMAAALRYRRRTASWGTELEGALPAFGSVVKWAPPMTGWGQSGDVVAQSGTTLTLSEPPVWTAGSTHYLCVLEDDGGVSAPITCTPGPSPDQVVLSSVAGLTITTADGTRERTKYLFGSSSEQAVRVRIAGITPRDRAPDAAPMFDLSGVVDDDRVHTADVALLPGVGVEQDPIDDGTGGSAGGGSIVIVNLTNAAIRETGVGESNELALRIRDDGRLVFLARGFATADTVIDQQWSYAVITPTQAADLEVRATAVSAWPTTSTGSLGTEAMGVWLSCGTSRTWGVTRPGTGPSAHRIRIEIRRASTGIVEGSAVFEAIFDEFGSGGAD